MHNRTVYSTVTHGHGDKRAERVHAGQVARMARAANRVHDPACRDEGLFCSCVGLNTDTHAHVVQVGATVRVETY